jgi:hypothetical protein
MLPENAGGVAALPAPNMDNMEPYTAAAGGMVAFDDGGSVARFSAAGAVADDERLRAERIRGARPGSGVSFSQAFPDASGSSSSGLRAFGQAAKRVLGPLGVFETFTGPSDDDVTRLREFDRAKATLKDAGFTDKDIDALKSPDVYRMASGYGYIPAATETTLAEASLGRGPNVHRPSAINPALPAPTAPAAPDAGGIADIAKADAAAKAAADKAAADKAAADKAALQTTGGLDTIGALESIKKDVGDKLEALGDPFADIREDVKKASAERKGELKQSMFMRIAEFGLGMAAGTSPFALVNAGKAGIAALKGLGDDLRERKKLDREDRKLLADIKRLEVADKRDNILKVGDMSMKIISEMGNENRAKVALNTQVILAREGIDSRERVAGMPGQQERVVDRAMEDSKFAAMYQKLNKPGLLLDPRVKIFMDMPYAEKEQLKLNNPAQYAMLEQLASQALLPTAVGSPDPSKIRP